MTITPALTDADLRLRSLLERSPVAFAFVHGGTIETVGEPFDHLFAHDHGSGLAGSSVRAVAVSDAAYAALAQAVDAAFGAGRPFDDEFEFVRADRSRFWGRVRAAPLRWDDPAGLALWFVEDVTEARRRRMQPHWQSIHDPVTELANRPEFDRRLADHLGSRRHEPVSVLVLDLDGFAGVNALFGEEGGNQALFSIGAQLVARVRASDLVARLYADRFGILLPGCDQHYAELLADKLRAEVARVRLRWGMKRTRVTARIGVAQIAPGFTTPQDVLDACAGAIAEAKAAGGDTVRVARTAVAPAAEAAA